MNRTELTNAIYMKLGGTVTKKQIDAILEAERESIIEAVAEGDKVTLLGFGSYSKKERKARIGRNPKTGERLDIPASSVPSFSPGKEFVQALDQPLNQPLAS